MKILYLNPGGTIGGAEPLLDMIASLRAAHPKWSFALVTGAPGGLIDEARALGVSVETLPFPPGLARAGDAGAEDFTGHRARAWSLMARLCAASPAIAMYAKRLARAIAKAAPNIVHTNGFKMHVLGTWTTPRTVPLVWHIHDFVWCRPVMSKLLRMHVWRCTAVLANSGSVARDIKAFLGRRTIPHTLCNAVDLNRFSPDGPRYDLDAICGLPIADSGTVRVGLVATTARWKGHEVFLRALSLVPPDVAIRGYIIGAPIYQTDSSQYSLDELRTTAASIGISYRVGFTGFVVDSAAAMRALDVVVHASTAPEPFGLVIAEALACGRPVIASAAGGAMEIIEPGKTGILHQPGDASSLASAITQLAKDRNLRRRLEIAARQAAALLFTRERLAMDLTAIYTAVATHPIA